MPKPIATWNRARGVWETNRVNLLCGHSAPFSQTWPASGMTRGGVAYAQPTWEPPTDASGSSSLLQTPLTTTADGVQMLERHVGGRGSLLATPRASEADHPGRVTVNHDGQTGLAEQVNSLLPTPRATDGTKGGPNQRGSSGDLMLPSAVQLLPTGFRPPMSQVIFELLPTPTAMDAHSSGGSNPTHVTLTDATVRTQLGARTNPRFADGNEP